MKLSKVLREAREKTFNDWWFNYSTEGFPTELERWAFLAGFDRAIAVAKEKD